MYRFKCNLCLFVKIKGVIKLKRGNYVHTKSFDEIPGPLSLPVIGTLYQYLPVIGPYKFDRLHQNGFKKLQKFGPVVKEQIVPGVFIVWLFRPEDIQIMYQSEGKYPQRRSHLALEKYRLDKPDVYNSGGLLPTNGPEWFRLRSVFQRGLSNLNSVRNFLPETEIILNEWVQYINKIKDTQFLDYLSALSRLFLELTCMTAFDLRLFSFSPRQLRDLSKSSRLMLAALTTNSCILKLDNGPQLWRKYNTPLYRKLKKSQEYMENVAVEFLSQKITFFDDTETGANKYSLLKSYLSSPELDERDIIGMAADFLLAGIDTTTYTASFLLYQVANNPRIQKKLHEESLRLLPDSYSKMNKDTLANCPYTRAVLKETFRMNPISVGVGRILDCDAVFSGYDVPKGTVVVSQNQISCRLEEYFSKPDEFYPERWLKDDVDYKPVHPFLVLPFGHGPRSCIARRLAEQNLLMFLIKVVRNFELGWEGEVLDSRSLLINKPDKPIQLSFRSR